MNGGTPMRKVIATFLFIAVIAFPLFLYATAQQGDILFLNGKKYFIYTNPLRAFLDKNPGKLPKSDAISSSNWRGYVATWGVKDDRFVLTDVGILRSNNKPGEAGLSTELHSAMSEMFPAQKEVVADWFTGHVIVPDGKLVNYVHMGYASTYEKYIILKVKNGIVIRNWTADTAAFIKFRDAQFASYKKTDEFRIALKQIHREARKQDEEEEFLREFYSETYMSMIFDEPR
jgi:hypothetical protein